MDAAEHHENRQRAVIEYANGALLNVAELDSWATSNKVPVSFETLLKDERIAENYRADRHFIHYSLLSVILASRLVPESLEPNDAAVQLMEAGDIESYSDPVRRLRDLVMVRYDRQLLSAVYDGDLNLYDSLTMSPIDLSAARQRYKANPGAYAQAAQARIMDAKGGETTPAVLDEARGILLQKFARLDQLAWALVVLAVDAPGPGEARYRQILGMTQWLQSLELPFRHNNGLPASPPNGVQVTGIDVREFQYLAVEDVHTAALSAHCWPTRAVDSRWPNDSKPKPETRVIGSGRPSRSHLERPLAVRPQSDRITIDALGWMIATQDALDAAESTPDTKADDGLRRTIEMALRLHGGGPLANIEGVIPQIADLANAGHITVHGDEGTTTSDASAISAKPSTYWLTMQDAQHVLTLLCPAVRRYALTEAAELIAKRVHHDDYIAEHALKTSLAADMREAVEHGELLENERRRDGDIMLNEHAVDEWLARERRPYRLGVATQVRFEQRAMMRAGRLHIETVAARLAKMTGVDATRWEDTLIDAIRAGILPLKNPRNLADLLPYAVPKNLRTFYDCVDVGDVNGLLDAHPEWHVAYRFAVHTRPKVVVTDDVPPVATRHILGTRSNPLKAIIDKAKESATDQADPHSIWAALVQLAQSKNPPAPLVGFADAEGVKWDDSGTVKFLTKKALGDRLRRAKAR